MSNDSKEQVMHLKSSDPDRFQRNTSFLKLPKDPEAATRNQNINNMLWNKLNTFSCKGVKQVINPKVIKQDRTACENIMGRII
jgi:hypothetical protein